jgi:hypothetical protein
VIALTGDAAVKALAKGAAVEAKVKAAATILLPPEGSDLKKKKNQQQQQQQGSTSPTSPPASSSYDVEAAEAGVLQLRTELDEV